MRARGRRTAQRPDASASSSERQPFLKDCARGCSDERGRAGGAHKTIWRIANDLRGSVDGWDFKTYVLGTLFYRFISENLTAYLNAQERRAGSLDFDYTVLSDAEAERGRRETVVEKGFYILPSELFANVPRRRGTTRTSTRPGDGSVTSDVQDDWRRFGRCQARARARRDHRGRTGGCPAQTRAFVERAFRDGAIPSTGATVTAILPPTSRFSDDGGYSSGSRACSTG